MSEQKPPEGDLKNEFRAFSENLKEAVNTAWQSEERHKLQNEIEAGLQEVGQTINNLVADFSASETGQKVVSEVDQFGEQLRSGEVEAQAREGLLHALRKLNSELQKAAEHFAPEDTQE